jgi:hypothetical protein
VGAGGGLTASVAYAARASPVAVIDVVVPVVLEVIQDKVADDSPGVVSNGRSAAGYSVAAVSSVDFLPRAAAANGGEGDGVTTVTVRFDLQPSYVLNLLVSVTPPLRVFSLMTAWLGLLGIGAFLLRAHMAAATKFVGAPTEAELHAVALTQQAEDIFSAHEASKRRLRVAAVAPAQEGRGGDEGMSSRQQSQLASFRAIATTPAQLRQRGGSSDAVPHMINPMAMVVMNRQAKVNDSAAPRVLPPGWTEHWSTQHNAPYFKSPAGDETWTLPVLDNAGYDDGHVIGQDDGHDDDHDADDESRDDAGDDNGLDAGDDAGDDVGTDAGNDDDGGHDASYDAGDAGSDNSDNISKDHDIV